MRLWVCGCVAAAIVAAAARSLAEDWRRLCGPRGQVGPDAALPEQEIAALQPRVVVQGRTAQAIQEACRRAVEQNKPVVYLPAVQYILHSTVRVPGGLVPLGAGSETVCRAGRRDTKLFRVDGNRVRFTPLKLVGADRSTSTDNDTYGIIAAGVQNVRVDHCELCGFSQAVQFASEATGQVDHCEIHHNLRDGLGYGVCILSGAYVLVCDNRFWQNRHCLASNGALDWSSPKRLGKCVHKAGVRKTHWEFLHNWVGSNDQSTYELCAVDTHPGMDGSFVIEYSIFEKLRHAIGIRDGSGIIRHNIFRDLRTRTTFRPLVAISISAGKHNGIPVEGCMPHDIHISDNDLVRLGGGSKYVVGEAQNIVIDGKIVASTRRGSLGLPVTIRLVPMGPDGILRWRRL